MEKDKTRRTPAEWEDICGVKILNALGWSQKRGQLVLKPYHKKISRREFIRRASFSSVMTN